MNVQGLLFHKEVKKRLIDAGMTQVQLANELGIKPAYLNDIIKGNRSGDNYMPKIIKILKMNDFVKN